MNSEKPLEGKAAVVTGASSGIGQAIGKHLAEAGAHVYLAGRTKETLDRTVDEIKRAGGKATAQAFDIRDGDAFSVFMDRVVQENEALHIMVNNAGLSYPGTIADGDPEQWREMLDVNVHALLLGCKLAIKAMRGYMCEGHIVNISSIAGRLEATGVYGATKSAVNQISRTLRKELENEYIRVVNICPGAVVTNFGRNFPPEVIKNFMKMAGIEGEFQRGEHMPEEAIPMLQQSAKQLFASADDIARTVVFAVTQPIELNIFDIEVRPQKALQL